MRVLFGVALLSLMALACAPTAEAPPPIDLEAERASLLQTDASWFEAYSASDSPADVFAAQVVADASLLPPGAPLAVGREAIREAIAALEEIPEFSVTWAPASAEVADAGDLGYTVGAYEMRMAPEGSPIEIVGKYLTVWKKQPDGSWMVVVDMFNADGPPAAADG